MGAGEQQKQPTVYHEVQLSYPQQPYVAGYPQVQQQQFGAGPGGASNQHITDATPPQPYPYGQSPKPLMYPPAASAMLPTMGTYQQPFAPPPAAGGLAYGPMTISSGQTDGCCPSAAQAASQGPPLKGGPCCCSFGWGEGDAERSPPQLGVCQGKCDARHPGLEGGVRPRARGFISARQERRMQRMHANRCTRCVTRSILLLDA